MKIDEAVLSFSFLVSIILFFSRCGVIVISLSERWYALTSEWYGVTYYSNGYSNLRRTKTLAWVHSRVFSISKLWTKPERVVVYTLQTRYYGLSFDSTVIFIRKYSRCNAQTSFIVLYEHVFETFKKKVWHLFRSNETQKIESSAMNTIF